LSEFGSASRKPASARRQRAVAEPGFGRECADLWHEERRSRIVALLRDGARASTSAIAGELGVSRETVRRDLLTLEAEGLLQRVHGGAIAPRDAAEAPFDRRRRQRWREKLAIGRAAARLVETGMIVFVDAGTTTLAFAEALAGRRDLRVVTNSIGVAQRLSDRAILLGGAVTTDVPATFGELTLGEIGRFMADLAFISPVAVHAEDGAMNYALHEAEVARAMIRRSRALVVLADRSKLDLRSRVTVCKPGEIDVLVTDGEAPPCFAKHVIAA
jgi:DeoR/GlpR family transcriptional regulator of sugar metabolism